MGNAMGCCGKSDDDPNNVNTTGGVHLNAKDFHSGEKLRRIVRIQAAFRGFLGRKRAQNIRSGAVTAPKSMMHHFNFSGPANYDNPEVQRIRSQLGEFNYGKEEASYGQREAR